MKRALGVILPFACLLILWLIIDRTLASGVVLAVAGVVSAGVIAMIFACGLSFLSCFRVAPSGFAEALHCITNFAKSLAKGNSASMERGRLRERMPVHRTQGKKP
jgi:multicomponent Na+:H+ antiporter subunit E